MEKFYTRKIAPDLLAITQERKLAPKLAGVEEGVQVIISLSPGANVDEFVEKLKHWILQSRGPETAIYIKNTEYYVFCALLPDEVLSLAESFPEIRMIWYDTPCQALLDKSNWCINALPARRLFSAEGEGVCWAVLDSGIDRAHPHFQQHQNILDEWQDFVGNGDRGDLFGHGTAVAGIIAGEGTGDAEDLVEFGYGLEPQLTTIKGQHFSGVAPKCKIFDLRVLNSQGSCPSSRLIQAMGYIRTQLNRRNMVVHGANISVGTRFDPQVYGAGYTPICEEANRLVNSGVVVVVAAGNDGYLPLQVGGKGLTIPKLLSMSINDPGNAEKVITVGSCHKENPHSYGISYFSSKGPTSDGYLKPDLIAPGEKVLTAKKGTDYSTGALYGPCSGTSFACPHVSGAIAAFLSAKREFIAQPQLVKKTFLDSATDLGRDKYFQGAGLVNVLRALENV